MKPDLRPTAVLALALLPVRSGVAQDPIYVFEDEIPLAARVDFDGDGHPDLKAHIPNALALISGRRGTVLRIVPVVRDERILDAVDLDGDGALEVLHTTAVYGAGDIRVRDVQGALRYRIPVPTGALGFGFGGSATVDWNRDTVLDLVVGDVHAGSSGRVYVFSGRDGTLLATLAPRFPHAFFGAAIASIRDVTGDGLDDLVIGQRGRVGIYAGGTGDHVRELGPENVEGRYGQTLEVAGDSDGDGYEDVVAGLLGLGGEPQGAKLCSGRTGAVLHEWTGAPGDRFGADVAGLGDVDGDGLADVAVSAWQQDQSFRKVGPGYVRVFSGRTGAEITTLRAEPGLDWFGYGISGTGDLDGDGRGDLIVGYATRSRMLVVSVHPRTLLSSHHVVDPGTDVRFTLQAGQERAGHAYLVMGSASGTEPGFELGSVLVPLNVDGYLLGTIGAANGPIFADTFGVLDAEGGGAATLHVPPLPVLRGLVLDHAFVTAGPSGIDFASNPVTLTVR